MIGKIGAFYNRIFESYKGSKFLQIDVSGEVVEWTEKGVKRFVFWNILFFVGLTRTLLHIFVDRFTLRSVILILIVSLYITEKSYLVFAKVLDAKENIDIIFSKPLEEKRIYKVLQNIMEGYNVRQSLERSKEE